MDHHSPQQLEDHLMKDDAFSRWMGVKVLEVGKGSCMLEMTVREEMLNGFGILHGGVSYAFADSALAFASNSHGRLSVALSNSMSYPAPAVVGDVISATAVELTLGYRTASYDITLINQKNEQIGLFRGTVYRTSKQVIPT